MSSNKNDIINKSSNGADGFDKLMKTLYSFLKATERQDGVGNSKTGSYTYNNTSTDPHTLSDGQVQTQNANIIESFSSALNIIKNIVDNNYMKLNNITISNDYYPLNSHKKIPALTDYQALADYWKNNGASACNGACVGYCSGSCAGGVKKGTGSNPNSSPQTGCSKCSATCKSDCYTTCHSYNRNDVKYPVGTNTSLCESCAVYCDNGCYDGCTKDCGASCGYNCTGYCSLSCGYCYGECEGNCYTGCSGCNTICGSGCSGQCSNSCSGVCGKTCGGTCMFGSNSKPIADDQNIQED